MLGIKNNQRQYSLVHELLEALKDAEKAFERLGIFNVDKNEYDWLKNKIDKAITNASGK